jgi:hypothetical protein
MIVLAHDFVDDAYHLYVLQDAEYKSMLLDHYVTRVTGGGLREHDVGMLKLKQVMM